MIITVENLEQMLPRTVLSDERKEELLFRFIELNPDNEFEYGEMLDIQDEVFNNLIDPIASGSNYGQADIINKLKQMGI